MKNSTQKFIKFYIFKLKLWNQAIQNQKIPFREDFPSHSTWKRCKHSGHFSRFRIIIGNFYIVKQKYVLLFYLIGLFISNSI
jgi:hypothetical protein